ncbi:conjugative transposon protein TraM [Nubsella zeaxanthinifaciens]|uniref:conjugative transposon protein TraM n=1 Tax=Nubsella zeaxanthinifaciens TaxID=392412 RepID=UPI003D01C429
MKKKIETRRILLFLPLLIIPLMALAFYVLGGGNGDQKAKEVNTGIRTELPDAKFGTDTASDKMAAYELAEKLAKDTAGSQIGAVAQRLGFGGLAEDPQTRAIEQRLEALNRQLSKPYEETAGGTGTTKKQQGFTAGQDETLRLEKLMKSMYAGGGTDPEMQELSGMLERIQEIQDPELARLKYQSDTKLLPDSQFRAIPAMVDGNQKALQGSVVKLKLLDTMEIGGYLIPKGYNVYALGSFSNQRLNLEIKNIRVGNSIIPVSLTVFDQKDAMVGINAPEALLSDAVRSGGIDAMGSVGLVGFDLTTQLAGAGIDAAKGLLTKKLRRIKQPLKSGYPILLRLNRQ